jgi:ubiquinol-cytochrome c reductase cytochrome c1 subunit
MKPPMKRFGWIAGLLLMPAAAMAAGGHGVALDKAKVDLSDTASLQRGAQLFVDNCLSCHSAKFMRYNRIGQDLGWTDEEVKQRLIKGEAKVGDTMISSMPVDYAKSACNGAVPPDLSLTTRSRGTDWLYTYLRSFYTDPARSMGVNNLLFKDVSMPNVFWREQGVVMPVTHEVEFNGATDTLVTGIKLEQPGTMSVEEFDAMIRDLVGFMDYMGEPAQLKRQALGPWVLGFLALFFVIVYLLKKEYWRDVK